MLQLQMVTLALANIVYYLLIKIELEKSNFSKVKELVENFSKICDTLCEKKNLILESLKNLEPKNES